MKDHDLKLTTWPLKAGLANGTLKSYFSKIENGEDATITYKALEKLAAVIGMKPWEMLGGDFTPPQIQVEGYVQAGNFCEEHVLEIDKYETIPEKLLGYDELKAFEVRGDSMDLVFPEGSVIFCQEREIYLHRGGKLDNSKFVVVQRAKNGEREYTVKRLNMNDDGTISLLPASTNALHRPIKFDPNDNMAGPDMANEGLTVEIIGVVLGAHTVFAD